MHCGLCGHSESGAAALCPSCGHAFLAAAAPPPPPRISPNGVRAIVYAAAVFALARGFAGLYGKYLAAEQERVEALLLGQALEHKKQVMLVQEAEERAEEQGQEPSEERAEEPAS